MTSGIVETVETASSTGSSVQNRSTSAVNKKIGAGVGRLTEDEPCRPAVY